MPQQIIGISGKRGAGKDLLATFLASYGYVKCPFAGSLKERVRMEFGLTKEHTDGILKEESSQYIKIKRDILSKEYPKYEHWTPREIMIAYGQFFRQFDKDWWIKKMFSDSQEFEKIVIPDVRFKNEADYIRAQGGIVVRLNRMKSLNIYGPNELTDISETELDDYPFDLVLNEEYNLYPTDLEDFAAKIITKIGAVV